MIRISPQSEIAHSLVCQDLQQGDIAVDATLGNGHDTLFLTQLIGDNGHVYGFDIQIQALQATMQRLRQHDLLHRATLIHASHSSMDEYIPSRLHGQIQVIMFNLGYLPGADKSIITQTESTLVAVDMACRLLATQGILTVLAYPGHAGGEEETLRLSEWCRQLDQRRFLVDIMLSQHNKPQAPRLFVIRKVS